MNNGLEGIVGLESYLNGMGNVITRYPNRIYQSNFCIDGISLLREDVLEKVLRLSGILGTLKTEERTKTSYENEEITQEQTIIEEYFESVIKGALNLLIELGISENEINTLNALVREKAKGNPRFGLMILNIKTRGDFENVIKTLEKY